MQWIVFAVISSYLIGSIPTAYVLGKLIKGKDLRQFGSRNIGATNAFRVLGKGIGITVLLLDIFKGIIPAVFIGDFIITEYPQLSPEVIRICLGFAGICGHNWTVFLRFKGGKGVAVSLGVLLGLAVRNPSLWIIFGVVLCVWILCFTLSRMVSLSSILASIAFPTCMVLFKQKEEFIALSIIISIIIIVRHKSNLKRIISNSEPRLF